jgi:hypothetical protein
MVYQFYKQIVMLQAVMLFSATYYQYATVQHIFIVVFNNLSSVTHYNGVAIYELRNR